MAERTEPCKQCGQFDFYYKGDFSYCRPCHSEAQRKYIERKRLGEEVSVLRPPSRLLSELPFTGAVTKLACPRGHPMSGDNVRMASQRHGRHLRRGCLTCDRNEKRVKYGLAPEVAPSRLSDLLADPS